MIEYFIYFIVFLILTFVLVIAVKAITRGIEAKENNKLNINDEKKKEDYLLNFNEKKKLNISNEIKELSDLYDKGVLSEEEFKKAKKKFLE